MISNVHNIAGTSVGTPRSVPRGGIVSACRVGDAPDKNICGLQPLEGCATITGFPGPNVATFTFLYHGKLRDDPGKHGHLENI